MNYLYFFLENLELCGKVIVIKFGGCIDLGIYL